MRCRKALSHSQVRDSEPRGASTLSAPFPRAICCGSDSNCDVPCGGRCHDHDHEGSGIWAAPSRLTAIGDVLLALQHFPVYTVGKRRTVHNLLKSEAALAHLGADICHVERGGDVTFHGPGQVVLYPILNLHLAQLGARRYVEGLEDVMIATAGEYGVRAVGRLPEQTGVWVGDRKLGAVGVRIAGGGVTTHGLAFNADVALSWFDHIVPCGIADKEVTSLCRECAADSDSVDVVDGVGGVGGGGGGSGGGKAPPVVKVGRVTEQLIANFKQMFGYS
eukprot:jgi/Mesen1/8856/ME000053S08262